MKITTTYFIQNQFIASGQFECDFEPHSLAYFCPTCGEVWGRILCTGLPDSPQHWTVETCACERHQPSCVVDWSKIPGTLTDAFLTASGLSKMWWGRALEHLPPEILQREFHLLLNYHAKEAE